MDFRRLQAMRRVFIFNNENGAPDFRKAANEILPTRVKRRWKLYRIEGMFLALLVIGFQAKRDRRRLP
jgi:hypothetical protein